MNESYIVQLEKEYDNFVYHYDTINYLIIGSSHSFGLLAHQFPDHHTINYGSYGEDYSRSYYKLKKVMNDPHVKKVQNVILNYDLGNMQQVSPGIENLFFWSDRYNFFEYGKISGEWSNAIKSYIKSNFFPYSGNLMTIYEYYTLDKNSQNDAPKGVEKSDNDNWRNQHISTKRNLSDSCLNAKINIPALTYIKKIIALCNKYDINLLLVKYPVSKHFYYEVSTCYRPEKYYNKLRMKLDLNKYSHIEVFDFQKLYFNKDEKFYDPHHLTSNARKEFTKLFTIELTKRGL